MTPTPLGDVTPKILPIKQLSLTFALAVPIAMTLLGVVTVVPPTKAKAIVTIAGEEERKAYGREGPAD
jgi:hypothetical protein